MKLTKSKIVMIVAAALGIVTIFMLLLAGLGASDAPKGADFPSVFNMMFGTGDFYGKGKLSVGTFNFLLFLPFLLLLVGIALSVVSLFVDNKILKIVAIACFVVAGIFFFLTKSLSPLSVKSDMRKLFKDTLKYFKLGIGAILAGIMSLLSGVAACVGTFVIKK